MASVTLDKKLSPEPKSEEDVDEKIGYIKFDHRIYPRKSLSVKKRRKSFQIFRRFFGMKKQPPTKPTIEQKVQFRRRSSMRSVEFWEV